MTVPFRRLSSGKIKAGILRGSRLSQTLSRGGRLWRRSPVDLPPAEVSSLWSLSAACAAIDIFLSHSWATPGWQKYVMLLRQFYWRPALAVAVLAAGLLSLLDFAGRLPCVDLAGVQVSLWSPIPALLGIATMFLAPALGVGEEPTVFFDATCINQADDQLKVDGIYSLGGFLSSSKKLLVMWTPAYFTRAWCVYEVAMYKALGAGRIEFRPPFDACFWLANFLCASLGTVLLPMGRFVTSDPLLGFCAKCAFDIPPIVLVTHTLRSHFWDMEQLPAQLARFDFDKASCRDARDLAMIKESIENYYGSTEDFNSYIRGPLKESVMAEQKTGGYWSIMAAVSPLLCSLPMWIAVQARAGMPPGQLACFAAGLFAHFVTAVPASLSLVFLTCKRLARPRSRMAAELAASGACALVGLTPLVAESALLAEFVDHGLMQHDPRFILADVAASAVLAAVVFSGDLPGRGPGRGAHGKQD